MRGWTGSSKIRPDIFPSQGLSEMSALDSCHQSVRAFLDTGGLSQRNEVFSMIWFLFFSLADWEQFTFYINHLKEKIMFVTSQVLIGSPILSQFQELARNIDK